MVKNFLPELLDRPLRQFPSLWSNFFGENLFPEAEELAPLSAARIYEENNQLHVEVPLPGLNLNDIEVSLNNGVLLINGEAREEEQDKKRKTYRSSKRSYSYSLILPTQIDEKQETQAEYVDGILTVSLKLPKKEEAKKITVKAGQTKK